MALITDPDNLNQGTEVTFNTTTKKITLNVAGNLSNDGVTLKALYSFCKEEWKSDAALIPVEFPFVPITDESFELVDGWDFANDTSRYLIRTGGWTVKNASAAVTQQWAGIIGLGSIESNDQLYYSQGAGATNAQLLGQINQAVKILDDPNGDGNYTDGFDRRSTFNLFVREQGQLFDSASLQAIGVSSLGPQAYRFPLTTGSDSKISASDSSISTNAPYTGMSISYYSSPQSVTISGSSYNFGIIIDANGGSAEQVYEFVQYKLRQTGNINAVTGNVVGKTANALLRFTGDDLYCLNATNPNGGGTGVYIENFQPADTNRLYFRDNTTALVQYDFVAVTTLNFNANLTADPAAIYRVFFTTNPAGDYGTSDAVLVHANDAVTATDISFNATSDTITTSGAVDFSLFSAGEYIHVEGAASNNGYYKVSSATATVITVDAAETPIPATASSGPSITISQAAMGYINGNSSVQFDFNYDNNTQGGRTAGVPAAITIVAIGLQTGQFVSAETTIGRSVTNSVSLVAPLERNYSNP